MYETLRKEIVTKEFLLNSIVKEYFDGSKIQENDEVYWIYIRGTLFKKNDIENSDLMRRIVNEKDTDTTNNIVDNIKNIEIKTKVALNDYLVDKLSSYLTMVGDEKGYPLFDLDGDIDTIYSKIMTDQFVSDLIREFGINVFNQFDYTIDPSNGELTVNLLNMSYHDKFYKYIKDVFSSKFPNIGHVVYDKFLLVGDTVEDTKSRPFKSYIFSFNEDKASFEEANKYLHDLTRMKKIGEGNVESIISQYNNKIEEDYDLLKNADIDKLRNLIDESLDKNISIEEIEEILKNTLTTKKDA